MKKTFVFAAALAAVFTASAATPVVKDGKACADVVLEMTKSHPQLRYAAEELTNWVAKITGAELRIVAKEADATQPVRIVLGTPALSLPVRKFAQGNKAFDRFKDNDGFVIQDDGATIYLAASKTKGVLNAVYRFLEKNSDIIWARPLQGEDGFGTVYGKTPQFANAVTNLVDVPSFVHHRHWTVRGESVARHSARLLNTWTANYLGGDYESVLKYGDPSEVQGSFPYHDMLGKYAESDPDIFALLPNGKRSTSGDFQICYTNPKTVEIFVNEAERLVKSAPKKVREWFLGIGDNWSLCECESCKKPIVLPDGRTVDPSEQCFRSTQYNLMVDKIAAELKKRCPNFSTIRSDGYLFLATAPAYRTTRPVGPYCPYVKNHKKPVFDDNVNKHWHDIAEGWKKSGQFFFSLYEYYLCDTTPLFPHAVCEVAQQDFKYYLPGLKGVYLDGGYEEFEAKDGRASLYELSLHEFWTMSRIMWDVNADVKECRREFCRRAYREAAPQMIEYVEKLAAVYNDDPTGCFWNDDPVIAAKHYIVEKNLAGWVRDILAKAEAAAVHPSSKELISRQRVRMLDLIDKAEKAPKRITYVVRQVGGEPDFDPESAYWKEVEKLGPVTQISDALKPVTNLTIKVTHDRTNLYFLFYAPGQQRFYNVWKQYKDANKIDNFPKDERFEWDTPYEIYLDGDLAAKGTYYMLSSMFNGHKTTCIGSSTGEPIGWSVKYAPIGTSGLATLATVPLADIGVDISKGNKIGAMFTGATSPRTAWNGGQWHSPGGFQTLQLEMK